MLYFLESIMTNTNRTRMSLIIAAIFDADLNNRIKAMEATPYQVGLFAEQDYRAGVSVLYTIRMDLVRMQDGADMPLQDVPKDGSLEANDTGTESDVEIERRTLMAQACRAHAVIERHLESLAKQAASDMEEAGKRTTSGGRYVIASSGRKFRAYCGSWHDFIIDLKANATAGSSWMLKIERAEELVSFPHVSAQDATDEFMDYFEDANVLKTSGNAWDKLLDRLEVRGTLLRDHEHLTAAFNAMDDVQRNAGKSEFAVACRDFKRELKNNDWWLERMLEPWALLLATGAPKDLVNSPEWRTKEAELRAAKARVKLVEVQAEMLELEALNAETEAMLALKAARARMAQLSSRNAALFAEFSPPTPKVAKAVKPAAKGKAVKAKAKDTPAKATKTKITIATSGIKTHTTRGRASFDGKGPRG